MTNPRAFPIRNFCVRYGIGRSKAYEEIKAGRLVAVKSGQRTLIREEDAETWLRSLPAIASAQVAGGDVVTTNALPRDARMRKAARSVPPRTVTHRKDGAR